MFPPWASFFWLASGQGVGALRRERGLASADEPAILHERGRAYAVSTDLIERDIDAYLEAHEHKMSTGETMFPPWAPFFAPASGQGVGALRRERGLASARERPSLHEQGSA